MALTKQANRLKSVETLPLYLSGLLLVLIGERVLASRPAFEVTLTAFGSLCLALVVVLKMVPRSTRLKERAQIDQWLGWLSLGTGLAIALALLVQHQPNWFGIRPELATDVRDRRAGFWNVAWLAGILFTMVPLLFAETAMYPMRRSARPEIRRVRAAAVAGLTLSMVALYGALFVYAAGKFGVAADYSYFKTAMPSESTKRIARSLKEPVRVVALFPSVNDVRSEVERYLHDLARGTPKLQVEFHDRLLEPKIARELRASQDGSVILARGEVRHVINIGVEQKNARATLRILDQEVQKNLMKLARDVRVAYLTVGHGELNENKNQDATSSGQGVQILRKLLETQNFRIQDLGVSQGLGQEVPQDADVVFVLGPREPLATEELTVLDHYAKRGGHLFLALDVDGRSSPKGRGPTAGLSKAAGPKSAPETSDTVDKVAAAVAGVSGTGTGANIEDIARIVGLGILPGTLANERIFVQRR